MVSAPLAGDDARVHRAAGRDSRVGPARTGPQAVEVVRALIERLPVSVVDLDAEIATHAAGLRARHRSLKLPDALVLATAERSGADRLFTTDRRWPTAKAMKLDVSIRQL